MNKKCRKKNKFILLILCAFIAVTAVTASAKGIMLEYDGGLHEYTGELYELKVNEQKVETPLEPIIFNDRALVPVREVFEAMGASVGYHDATKRIDVSMGSTSISLNINSSVAYINGQAANIPDNVVPKLIAKQGDSAKTMVPVRFISESIGMDVDFDGTNGVIDIKNGVTPIQITDVTYQMSSDTQIDVTVKADSDIQSHSDFTLSDPSRVVVDIPNSTLKAASKVEINKGAVSAIRLGESDGKTRIVIDTQSIQSYTVSSAGNQLMISLTTKTPVAVSPTTAPTVTQKPVNPTPKPTAKPTVKPTAAPVPSNQKLIIIDPGHGGKDGGADGVKDGTVIYEKDLALSISKKVVAILKNNGYQVEMTREGDTYPELTERSDMANERNAAMFVSIHINSVKDLPEANGTEVYYSTQNNGSDYGATSQELAKNVLKAMIEKMGTRNRGVKTANHVVTRTSKMPAILVEVGFITNAEELDKMLDDNFQNKVAEGIARGIMETMGTITVPAN